jgi:aquaporin Z
VGAVFLTEVVLTFLLVFTVLGATDVHAPVGFAGLGIGLVLTLIHLVGIPIDNLSVNPARSIGPAIFVGGWALEQLWLFLVAPLVGGAIAAVAYQVLHQPAPTVVTLAEAQQALPSQQDQRLAGS